MVFSFDFSCFSCLLYNTNEKTAHPHYLYKNGIFTTKQLNEIQFFYIKAKKPKKNKKKLR